MVQSDPAGIKSKRRDGVGKGGGGRLLQELEELNQALSEAAGGGSVGALTAERRMGGGRDTTAIPPPPPLPQRSTVSETTTQAAAAARGKTPIPYSLTHPALRSPSNSRFPIAASRPNNVVATQSPWHSQGFEKYIPEVRNFPDWLEESLAFSQRLEIPAEEEDTKKKKKKRSSVWNWKPFRALAHLGQQKLNCLFTVLVHAIEGLPPGMYGMRLAVHFCRKDDEGVCTSPSRVFDGVAEFEESLDLRSSVYGSKNGGAQGGMKYESREFTLSVIAVDVDGLILGKHKLDLTRLLPKNLDDNYERQESWRTSFQLTGKAKGSTLVVTLGYDFLKKDVHNINLASSLRFGASPVLRAARSFNSLPNSGHASPREHRSNSQHVSPALSEPPANSSDYLGMVGMEHLSLDESLTVSPYCLDPSPPIGVGMQLQLGFRESSSPSEATEPRAFSPAPLVLEPLTPGNSKEGTSKIAKDFRPETTQGRTVYETSDEEVDFTVVDQGVEMGTLSNAVAAKLDEEDAEDAEDSEHTSVLAENHTEAGSVIAFEDLAEPDAELEDGFESFDINQDKGSVVQEDHEAKAEDEVEDTEYSDKDSEETQVTVVTMEVELEEGDEVNEKNEATLHNNMKLELEPKEAQGNDAEQGDGPQLNIPMLVLDVKEEEKTEESQLEFPMLELEPEEDKEEGEETQLKVATLASELEDEGSQLKIAPLEPELEKEKGEEEVQLNVSTSEEVGPEEDKEEFEETQHKLSLLELKSEDYKGDEETKLKCATLDLEPEEIKEDKEGGGESEVRDATLELEPEEYKEVTEETRVKIAIVEPKPEDYIDNQEEDEETLVKGVQAMLELKPEECEEIRDSEVTQLNINQLPTLFDDSKTEQQGVEDAPLNVASLELKPKDSEVTELKITKLNLDFEEEKEAEEAEIKVVIMDLQSDRDEEISMDEQSEMLELLDCLGGAGALGDAGDQGVDEEQGQGELSWAVNSPYCFLRKHSTTHEESDLQEQILNEELLLSFPTQENLIVTSSEEDQISRFAELDDEIDRVAGEFLDLLETQAGPVPLMLTSDSESDSPRARLLKQFEQEAMLEGGLSLGLDLAETPALYLNEVEVPELYLDGMPEDVDFASGHSEDSGTLLLPPGFNSLGWGSEQDVELASIMETAESELQKATQSMLSKSRGKLLEDAETEALMQQWGLNKKVFEGSPPKQPTVSEEYGNDLYALTMAESPALGKDVGPIVHTRDGGSLRSMSPGNFKKNGQLVMQVSKPVVVPGEMGSSSMDILRQMAITGIEGMADQTRMVMPLEDITGKTVEEIASEGLLALKGGHHVRANFRNGYAALGQGEGGENNLHVEYGTAAMATRFDSSMATSSSYNPNRHHGSLAKMSDDTFVSLEDLAPMAMQQIEALALEGLKIQSDMAEEDAPYNVYPLSWEEIAALEDGRGSGGSYVKKIGGVRGIEIGMLEGAAASVRLLEGGAQTIVDGESQGTSGGYGLLSMAISLDEWMQLDAGIFDETASILAAHKDVSVVAQQKDKGGAGANNIRGGFMGDILNLAMLVQLRDPLRNYEPVGAPMMALVQAERVMLPPPQVKVGRWVSMKRNNEDVEEDPQAIVPQQPQFKILEVTMSGLKTSDEGLDKKKKLLGWGSHKQQQSGSRWLVANGMNKVVKHPVLQSRAPAPLGASKKIAGQGDSLWSISAKTGSKWKTSAPNSKTRNPDVAFGKSIYGKRK